MAHSFTLSKYWQFDFETTIYVINRLPSRYNNKFSLFELVHKNPPDYHSLKDFVCLYFPYLHPCNKHKFEC